MARLQDIRSELDADTLTRGYAGMTNAQAAADMMTLYRTRTRFVTGQEILSYLVTAGKYDAVIDLINGNGVSKKAGQVFDRLMNPSVMIDVTNANTQLILDLGVSQGVLSAGDKTAIIALGSETITRAEELGFGSVNEGDITHARAL